MVCKVMVSPDLSQVTSHQVRFILDHYKGAMTLEKQHPYLGSPGLATTSLNEEERNLVQRFDPTEMEEMTGFFIAKFKKASRNT